MEQLMYDIYIAEAIIEDNYNDFNTPEKKEAIIAEVFKRNKTSQARWDTSLAWYSDKVEEYLKMNDSVRLKLQRNQKEVEALLNNELAIQQSIKDRSILSSDIPLNYSFAEVNPRNGFRFELDSTSIQNDIDSVNTFFSFEAFGIPESMNSRLTAQLILEYKDTTIFKGEYINTNGTHSIHINKYIENDTLHTLTGFVKLNDKLSWYRNIQLRNIYLGNLDSLHNLNNNSTKLDTIAELDKPILQKMKD